MSCSPRSPLRAFVGRYLIAFTAALVLMGGMVFAVNYVINSKLDDVPRVNVDTAPAPPEGANYLLIGSDTREFVANETEEEAFGTEADTGGQRSDTMMVVHVEPAAQRTLVVSFPRDLWVEIPGEGDSKINAAFNSGPDKVIETLKANFGIEINHYLEVDFKSFEGIVKAIGSVPVYFPYATRDEKTGLNAPFAGCFKLDGNAALKYVRSRALEYWSVDNQRWVPADLIPDINRIARQQDFIRKLAGLAVQKSLNNPLTANEVADRILENLTIDDGLTKDDIFSLIDAFRTVDPDDTSSLEMLTFPYAPGTSVDGQDVLFLGDGYEAMVARLADFSGNASPAPAVDPATISLEVRNGSDREGVASAVLAEFERLGFRGEGSGNDRRAAAAVTEVRYKPGAQDKGETVLRYVEPAARLVEDPGLEDADVAVVLGADFDRIVVPPGSPTAVGRTEGAPESPVSTPPTTGMPASEQLSEQGTPAPIANADEIGYPAPRKPPC